MRVTSIERDNSVVFVVSVHQKSALPNDLIGSTSASENLLSPGNGYRFVCRFSEIE
jgi:hypothetical protein